MAPQWTGLDPELEAIFNDDKPDGPELPRKKVPTGDVYEASRAGDVERLRWLLELGVNVNARDAWDSVALYYACLAGHLDAAHMLLENGAICSENTFDGDRCHYAALNLRVRKLLKAYEARPPPLAPLPASLRELFMSSYPNLAYLEGSLGPQVDDSAGRNSSICDLRKSPVGGSFLDSYAAPDVTFCVSGRAMQVHRAILAARSPYFRKKFEMDWRHRREFRFSSSKLSFGALFSLLHFFYTDRLDVAVDDMEDLVRICKVCECVALQKCLEKEISHQKFASYKSLREPDDSQKRFILQGTSLPWPEQLHAQLRRLFLLTLANKRKESGQCQRDAEAGSVLAEKVKQNGHYHDRGADMTDEGMWTDDLTRERSESTSEACSTSLQMEHVVEDHADVIFLVAGEKFRCHRAILASRSEYFKARFFRALDGEFAVHEHDNMGALPVLKEHDLKADVFSKLLEYIYTDSVAELDPDEAEEMFDAASRYLLFTLKRAVVDVLLPHLESTPPAELCRWLLMADMYGVTKLREHCLDAMALNFDLFAAAPEFRQMLLALPPPSGDDATRTSAPSVPGEAERGSEVENLLDDLREKWLTIEGEELDRRDESAREFDRSLVKLMEMAFSDNAEREIFQESP